MTRQLVKGRIYVGLLFLRDNSPSWQQVADTASGTAENSHLKPKTRGRESELGMACGLETPKPAFGDHFPLVRPHSLNYPSSTTAWGPNIQIHVLMGTFSFRLPHGRSWALFPHLGGRRRKSVKSLRPT